MNETKKGVLYICATPIGNLLDITLRVIKTLEECDVVFAEDTRRTLGLLNHLKINKQVLSCFAHNEKSRANLITDYVKEGKSVAYCSDAGMPGISDPGFNIISACIERGLPFVVLPGASALLTAAVMSGLNIDTLSFYGFLPRDKKQRRDMLLRLKEEKNTFLIYENPLRIPNTIQELYGELGDRPAALMRELTKIHEECIRGTLKSLSSSIKTPPKGECVLAVCGSNIIKQKQEKQPVDIEKAAGALIKEGFTTKDAAKAISGCFGIPKKEAYAITVGVLKDKA